MNSLRLILGTAFLLFANTSCSRAESFPKTIPANPCRTAPTIDGVIGVEEWKEAQVIAFDMRLVRLKPVASVTRHCELRVMNSTNALYVAFRVPDETVNRTLSPLDLDLAILAFSQGEQLRAGDDRKVVAEGLYSDKHVASPGKGDADDTQQDGRGAMGRKNGTGTFEWAIPLNSADAYDFRAKPGDPVRFNLAYCDAFHPELRDTWLGVVQATDLDHAEGWGTIRLAANVTDDGGTAFRGPAWVGALFKTLQSVPANRLRLTDSTLLTGMEKPGAKALVWFAYRDEHGQEKVAQAKIYLPAVVHEDEKAKIPLYFAAGYELDDASALGHVQGGWAIVSPRALATNPLIRTVNPDVALLHIARALPFVDDARVVVAGGSAGGFMTLLLAAETFPLAGAAPDVPPVNWGYNAAYFFKQKDIVRSQPKRETAPKVPALFGLIPMLEPCTKVYGEAYSDSTWFADSPLAHVSTITCSVSVYWSTADVLVPMNQISDQWVQRFNKDEFPEGFTMEPEKLTTSREGRLRLMDVLPANAYEIFELTVPSGTARHNVPGSPGSGTTLELSVSTGKLWSIGILDEGPPEPRMDHRKYDLFLTRSEFLERVTQGEVAPGQLTATKLARLMDRYAGKEWLASRLKHLDFPASERADVVRGLETYVRADLDNAKTFAELYANAPVCSTRLEPTRSRSRRLSVNPFNLATTLLF
jgi:hypothetical protein